MEERNKNICIKVDNAKFVTNPEARLTLKGVIAYLECAIETGQTRRLNTLMCQLLIKMVDGPKGDDIRDKMDTLLDNIGKGLDDLEEELDEDKDKW